MAHALELVIEPLMPAPDPVVLLLAFGRGLVLVELELCREKEVHHRRDESSREEVGREHGEDNGHGERCEEELCRAGEQDDRDEDDADGEGRDEGGSGDLLGGVEDGAHQRLLLCHVAVRVLDLDGRVVDENADGEGEAAEGHDVDGLVERREDDERGGDREGNGGADDQGTAPAAEEEQDHEAGEDRGNGGFAGDLGDGVADEDGLIEERCNGERVGQTGFDPGERGLDAGDDVEGRGATVFEDGEQGRALSVLTDDIRLHGIAFADLSDILDVDDRAVGSADGQIVERGDLAWRGVQLDHKLAVAEAGGAGGKDEVLLVDGERDVGRGEMLGREQIRVGVDLDLTDFTAVGERHGGALHVREARTDKVQAEIVELLFAETAAAEGQLNDGYARGVVLQDQRREAAGGQNAEDGPGRRRSPARRPAQP